jgi:hypothetical protein
MATNNATGSPEPGSADQNQVWREVEIVVFKILGHIPSAGEVRSSLCDLHLLLDDISAASNQVRSRKLQEELDLLYERLEMVTQSYEEHRQ